MGKRRRDWGGARRGGGGGGREEEAKTWNSCSSSAMAWKPLELWKRAFEMDRDVDMRPKPHACMGSLARLGGGCGPGSPGSSFAGSGKRTGSATNQASRTR
jgi:hypothetical protein